MINLCFHVGPPKTGTSVIQKFLLDHRQWLLGKGVFYPSHFIDANGVSAGHKGVLFSGNTFDSARLQQLKTKAERAGCHTLLLSSEAFFVNMQEIRELCPEASFILYLREPLSHMESDYNQAVKRNGETRPFHFERIDYAKFRMLENFIFRFGMQNLIIRFFQPTCLKGGNLIADFLHSINLEPPPKFEDKQINPSYSLPALELKRMANRHSLSRYANLQLDKLLQRYHDGEESFTLVSPEDFYQRREEISYELTKFFNQYPTRGSDIFLQQIKKTEPKPYRKQQLGLEEGKVLSRFIQKNNGGLYFYLQKRLKMEDSWGNTFELGNSPMTLVHQTKALLFRGRSAVYPILRPGKK